MAEETRRIVAILFSDIVGFTAAMGRDEHTAVRAVSRAREVQKELVRKFRGEWLQEIGDGALCTFDSAVEAVECALEIQRAFQGDPDFSLRIGIHVGDLIFRKTETGYDVFGDGVNVASRVQGAAEAAGICVSERVYDDLRNRPGIECRFMGEKQLKNVNRPIGVYEIIDRAGTDGEAPAGAPVPVRAAPGRKRGPLLAAAGLGGAALLGLAAFAMLRSGPAAGPSSEAPGADLSRRAPEPAPAPPALRPESGPPPGSPARTADPPAGASGSGAMRKLAEELEPLAQPPPQVAAVRPPAEAGGLSAFQHARRALLGAAGPWTDARAQVWIDPNPVGVDEIYRIHFKADCDCTALLFSVDGTADEIRMLYPNPYEPQRRLQRGQPMEIPSSGAYHLRAVGGRGMDMLKLFVARDGFAFPPPGVTSWGASPDEPARVAELTRFLEEIDGDWAVAATPLNIAR